MYVNSFSLSEHTELEPTYRRDIIEYYDMLLNVYGSMHTSFQMYCELADKAQNLPVKDVNRTDGTDPAEGTQ